MKVTTKKQPTVVRQNLLTSALQILDEMGMQGFTLEAVAKKAGVSKGGLLHHYPSKQALIDGMVSRVFDAIKGHIEQSMAEDPVEKGRFTRAYINAMNIEDDELEFLNSIPLTTLMFEDEAIRKRWRLWLAEQLKQHADTDGSDNARIIRFAVDGLWLSGLLQYDEISLDKQRQLLEKLKQMTFE